MMQINSPIPGHVYKRKASVTLLLLYSVVPFEGDHEDLDARNF